MPSSPTPTDAIIGVAVPVPGLGLLSYRTTHPPPPKGARVVVPIGPRALTGIVVDPAASVPDGAELRDVNEVLDRHPFLPPDVVDLALWVGEYYACGPGDALAIALPPAARRGEATSFRTKTVARLSAPDLKVPGSTDGLVQAEAGSSEPQSPEPLNPEPNPEPQNPEPQNRKTAKTSKQRDLVAALSGSPAGVSLPELSRRGFSSDVVRRAAKSGLVVLTEEPDERDPFAEAADGGGALWSIRAAETSGRPLTAEQTDAFARLVAAADARAFRPVLLHGVTGSGKTELYVRLARHVIGQGRSVLVLVPEIALTPAVAGVFRAAFGGRTAIQHSGLSVGERHDQWHRIRRGQVDVVVGTRSAVFAPLERLGLIIVDEEHESAYKQDETPRYHGRDVAVMRAQMDGAMVLLGSATPSLESSSNAEAGRYARVMLTRRVLDRPLAETRIVDMRRELAAHGLERAISEPLAQAMELRLARGEQSLVLLNRRGFATVIFCRQCGSSLECPHCSVTLTYHRAARRVRCHYCNYSASVPKVCGDCGGEFLEQSGVGTERLEAEVRERFPTARISRVDRDTIRRRGAIARVLKAVAAGEIDILVGTQMIAKGHDFPSVTLVGVVSADVGLGLADFRAGERTFQLLTQVIGRAGRGDARGEAIVQTLYPDHYSVQAAAAQDYATFLARELEFRRAMLYPPALALINVVVKGRTLEGAMADALDLATRVRASGLKARVLGPAPAALSRLKDEYRAQFFIKGNQRRAMREALLAALAARPDVRKRTIVDVDPMSVT
ncbi:MAG: primosomal protein N' [Acidobacteriota bacterium]